MKPDLRYLPAAVGTGGEVTFADLETEKLSADSETLTPEACKVMDLLKLRPMQFCLFLKALVCVEEMQRMTVQAIEVAMQHG